MKAATGMWATSSVILSTRVITLSTLSRYLPKDGNVFVFVYLLSFTSYNDNCTGIRNIHAIGFRNKLDTIPCIFIIQSHPYLIVKSYQNYRVSQKKCPYVLNCHNSIKIGTRTKSRVSFEILRNSSCWWALKFFNFDFWGRRKWGLKLVTLCLKAWPNQPFSGPVCLMHIEKWNTLILHLSIYPSSTKENHWWKEVL